ncbi:hypothetical protein FTO74_11740 [Granulicella sp. WH15]|uniref:hypothetical protein n=1 Tax=Granulicella sp. WH15 TaxID=2602070 RepID=UPI0013673262|nr:hypothetical protein [Granulicella sp. WH15]QHN03969.1 hypothetical protein FTO74_11740 [Granulicella sp. WH15]
MRPLRSLSMALGFALATSAAAQDQPPTAKIDNGILHATIYLPDAANGFYRGTRFDWSGIIGDLAYAGHSYYGPWFTKIEPGVRDYIFDGADITAGSASAITGPSESFDTKDGLPLGFSRVSSGQTFVKIGIGVLRKPDDQKYSPYRQYEIVDHGKWKVKARATSIEFTQTVVDRSSGYGYRYTKTLRLLPGKPVLVMDHVLKNLGREPIVTEVFNHNFLVLDHQPTGPGFSVSLPFAIAPEKPIKRDLGTVDGNRISYRKQLEGKEVFTVQIGGFAATPQDNDFRVENNKVGAGVRITGDRPLAQAEVWSIRSTVAVEPFVSLSAAPGETIRWSNSYLYYTLPETK